MVMNYHIYHQGLRMYNNLNEVPLPDNITEGEIDKRIEKLVRALQSIRVSTRASCGGHIRLTGYELPWVGCNPFQSVELEALSYLVVQYNKGSKIKWVLKEGRDLVPHIQMNKSRDENHGISRRELRKVQQNADELAEYVFVHRGDEEIQKIMRYGVVYFPF